MFYTSNVSTDKFCFELLLPKYEYNKTTYPKPAVQVEVQTNYGILKGENLQSLEVVYYNDLAVTFIRTDRQIYKPGDVVKICIFTVNTKFSTYEFQTVIPKAIIFNFNLTI